MILCEVIIIQHYESISHWLVVSRCPVIRMLPSDLNIGLNTLNGHSSRVMIRRSHPLIRINEPITSRVAVNVNTIRFIFLIDRFI